MKLLMKPAMHLVPIFIISLCMAINGYASHTTIAKNSLSVKIDLGFVKSVHKYCLEIKEVQLIKEKKCRTLVLTEENVASTFLPFYERFEKDESVEQQLVKIVDAVTYFKKDQRVVFDEFFSPKELHKIDLFYPENINVHVTFGVDGFPDIENLYLARFEDAKQLMYAKVSLDYSFDEVVISGDFFIYSKDDLGNISSAPRKFPVFEVYTRN